MAIGTELVSVAEVRNCMFSAIHWAILSAETFVGTFTWTMAQLMSGLCIHHVIRLEASITTY